MCEVTRKYRVSIGCLPVQVSSFFVLCLSFSFTRGTLRQENVSPFQISKLNFNNRNAAAQKDIIIK